MSKPKSIIDLNNIPEVKEISEADAAKISGGSRKGRNNHRGPSVLNIFKKKFRNTRNTGSA